MVLEVLDVTVVVVTVKVAVVAPAATVTEAGTVALAPVADSVTGRPPDGAGPLRVTVPVEGLPPITDAGLSESAEGTGALMVRIAVLLTEPVVAVIVELVLVATAVVVTVKVAVVAPAGTVTELGTVAGLVAESPTEVPPVGAAPVKVTVPVDEFPPVTVAGLTATEATVGSALIVRVALFD
jgi:hypothetical protein